MCTRARALGGWGEGLFTSMLPRTRWVDDASPGCVHRVPPHPLLRPQLNAVYVVLGDPQLLSQQLLVRLVGGLVSHVALAIPACARAARGLFGSRSICGRR